MMEKQQTRAVFARQPGKQFVGFDTLFTLKRSFLKV